MGEMAASLAHQIRTPLASAMLYVSHLTQPVVETEQRQRIAEKIYSGLRHLEKLVNDMLVFTRGGTVGIEPISVASLLQEVRNLAEATVLNGGCQLSVADEAPGSVLHGNREALIGALHNLITNAIQACGQGGTIHLQARTTDTGMTELLVADNGPGISTGIQERIFEPFFTTRTQGVGLGLAVVQACARAHNGNLSLQSQLGQGSTFAITLPTATDSTEPFIAELSMVSAETECRPMNGNPS